MAFGCLGLTVLIAGGLIWQSSRSHITPYVVEVDHLGDVKAVGPASETYRPADALIAHHLERFTRDVRSVPLDPIVLRDDWLEAYDYTTERGATTLNEFARANDPFAHVGQNSVAIEVTGIVRASDNSFQVRGVERGFANGAPTTMERWTAILSIVMRPPAAGRRAATAQESLGPVRRRIELESGIGNRRERKERAVMKKRQILGWVAVAAITVTGCASKPSRDIPLDEPVAAVKITDPARPVEIVEVPKILPLPGQLKPMPATTPSAPEAGEPQDRVKRANDTARVEPSRQNYLNATQVWPYSPDALYQVYASPEKISDIALEAGEEIVSVSAGDTVRWVVGDTISGAGTSQRVHILVKPTRADLKTNLVINTNRRTYHLELTATADTWMAAVSWQYPLDQLAVLRGANAHAEAVAPVTDGIALDRLNFRYEVTGANPSWRPLRAFDDGSKVYVQFPAGIGQGEMPPLFILGNGDKTELVNYRVRSPYYIVDRLFAVAELRLGGKDAPIVRITRTDLVSAVDSSNHR